MLPIIGEEVRGGQRTPVYESTYYDRAPEPDPVQRFIYDIHRDIEALTDGGDRAEYERLKSLVDGFAAMKRAYLRTAPDRENLNTMYSFMARSAPVSTRSADRVLSFIASTPSLDRHGSKISSMGIDTSNYERDPVVGFGHDLYGGFFSAPDPASVIGKTIRLRKSPRALEADVQFLESSINPKAEMIYQMLLSGALTSMSIGFIPKRITVAMEDGREIPTIEECELLELSVVPIPSNVDAVLQK